MWDFLVNSIRCFIILILSLIALPIMIYFYFSFGVISAESSNVVLWIIVSVLFVISMFLKKGNQF